MLLGHSGVGKSTLVNRLVPEADRATGEVSEVGKGRHTSAQSVAFPLPDSGWVIDTPGIRSFGLAHIEPDDVLLAFSDLAEAIKDCPRGCGHMGPPADPECALDTLSGPAARRVAAARRLLAALAKTAGTAQATAPWVVRRGGVSARQPLGVHAGLAGCRLGGLAWAGAAVLAAPADPGPAAPAKPAEGGGVGFGRDVGHSGGGGGRWSFFSSW